MKPILLAAGLLLLSAPAWADRVAPITDAVTLKACGECHMAFQPDFLPARSWTRIMETLGDHYGDSATMAPDKADHIRRVLEQGAGDRVGGKVASRFMRWVAPGAAPLRSTANPAFLRKHDFPDREWKRPEVMTKSNCVACHKLAERGDYEED
jgi:hypothetical protein